MTGGAGGPRAINARLAEAAQERRIAMGVGSQRAALESADLAESFEVGAWHPTSRCSPTSGAVQLNYGYGVERCQRAVDMIEADALILHLNPLQEALQPEGDTRWSGLLARDRGGRERVDVPVIAKEVGWGSRGRRAATGRCGRGGHRRGRRRRARAGARWRSTGRATARAARDRRPVHRLGHAHGGEPGWRARAARRTSRSIASGGLRDGVDVAKCVAPRRRAVRSRRSVPARAAHESTEAVVEQIDLLCRTLRVAMFAVGVPAP